MAVKEVARQAGKMLKDELMKKLRPILLKYVLPVVIVFLLFISMISAFAGGAVEEASTTYNTNGMSSASGSSWEIFVENFIKKWEGNEGIDETGTKYRIGDVLGNRTVGHGIDLETSGAEEKLKSLGYTDSDLQVGCYIDIDIIDNIMENELKNIYDLLINSTKANNVQAKEYQIFAFVDFGYNDRKRKFGKIL